MWYQVNAVSDTSQLLLRPLPEEESKPLSTLEFPSARDAAGIS